MLDSLFLLISNLDQVNGYDDFLALISFELPSSLLLDKNKDPICQGGRSLSSHADAFYSSNIKAFIYQTKMAFFIINVVMLEDLLF